MSGSKEDRLLRRPNRIKRTCTRRTRDGVAEDGTIPEAKSFDGTDWSLQ